MTEDFFKPAIRISRNYRLYLLIVSCTLIGGCGGNDEEVGSFPSPQGYDLNRPVVSKLPPMLDEISGILFYPKDKSLFAIHDERGWLYKIYTNKELKIEKWKYAGGADFEDIALADSIFFTIKSNGDIVAFRFLRPDSASLNSFHLPDSSSKKEFETIYFDSTRQQLMMVCKDCESDPKNKSGVFAFDYKQLKYVDSPVFFIDGGQIEKKLGDKMPKFKPSAGAINPKTGELFLISSVNKILVVTEPNGKVKDVYQLDSKLFKQPEGLTFTPGGDLLISNESAGIGPATILLFKYKESPQR
ncbi:MAG TPA: SdiA-regulated domain-containing protein [Chitinophagaceae bacterium]|nr:SdiA-regulated domain-containing protein [Chitinophagaceae bacterium]